uniref:Cyclin-dependent kinases regulatory subunit n=1 Tax=Macrostomum lignano TaxID=282301 RepID=A0A1I8FG21_9PLAT
MAHYIDASTTEENLLSEKYRDDVVYEYRHCHLPKELLVYVPKNRVMTEDEWRGIGIQQSEGWVNYMVHQPEPHIILFRRPIAVAEAQAQKAAAAAAGGCCRHSGLLKLEWAE